MKKLMIFDDEEDILSICKYIFEEDGWQVTGHTNCRNLLERVKEFSPDVIIMDNWIPEDGGVEATQAIKVVPELAHIPVIYLSANSDVQGLAQIAGAEYYMTKPFDLEPLKEIVYKAYENKKPGLD